jgi:hypothetical protein
LLSKIANCISDLVDFNLFSQLYRALIKKKRCKEVYMLMIIDEAMNEYSKAFVFYLTTPDNDYYYSKELTLLFSWLQYQHQLVGALSSSSRDQIRLFYDKH